MKKKQVSCTGTEEGGIQLQEEETVMSKSRQRLFLFFGTKQAETASHNICFQVFQFYRWKTYFFYIRHLGIFRLRFLQFSLFMLSNPPVHQYAARLPVVLMLMIPSCLQVTIKQETTFHLQHFEAGCTLQWLGPSKQSTPLD